MLSVVVDSLSIKWKILLYLGCIFCLLSCSTKFLQCLLYNIWNNQYLDVYLNSNFCIYWICCFCIYEGYIIFAKCKSMKVGSIFLMNDVHHWWSHASNICNCCMKTSIPFSAELIGHWLLKSIFHMKIWLSKYKRLYIWKKIFHF